MRFDSSDSYATFDKDLFNSQKNSTGTKVILYPEKWAHNMPQK